MKDNDISRRRFVHDGALAVGAGLGGVSVLAPGAAAADIDTSKIVNYNQNMEYRRQGSTDWMDTSTESQLCRQREVGEFLEGYTAVRALSEGELAVQQLGPAVHHIFLMGLVLRYWTSRDGWHWANDDFINWHMKWFRHWNERHVV